MRRDGGKIGCDEPPRLANRSRLEECRKFATRRDHQTYGGGRRGRARYRRIADRVAGLYAPAVHLLALISFLAWEFVGGDWKHATFVAVSVQLITCPCALGLAVPVVQVVTAGNVFRRGITIKDGSALKRPAGDTVVFDKSGTFDIEPAKSP
ncbi:heavy metal translocating P-type ATPase-associated domain protein (plasmid) [Rhizobium etli bv. mimosae str. Mim1]|nr:heavy metal translocating P-type ATPase-associated domain protein [Rhizobium etli bv. mimosae str. Mim1]